MLAMRMRLPRAPWAGRRGRDAAAPASDYAARLVAEQEIYAEQEVVHDLPPIFHVWSNQTLKPMMDAVGIDSVDGLFASALESAYRERTHGEPARFVSIGAGNCD